MIDNDTDSPGLLPADSGLLELGKCESTALTDFAVVADGLRADSGTEERLGADAEGGGLGFAGIAAAELAPRLVEPGADTALPVLAEMVRVEDCEGPSLTGCKSNRYGRHLTVVVCKTHVLSCGMGGESVKGLNVHDEEEHTLVLRSSRALPICFQVDVPIQNVWLAPAAQYHSDHSVTLT